MRCITVILIAALGGCFEPAPTPTAPVTNGPRVYEGAQGITVSGLTFRESNRALIFRHGNGNTMENCTFEELGYGAIEAGWESNFTVRNCTFRRCDLTAPVMETGWIAGKIINLYYARNVRIENCTFTDMRGGFSILIWIETRDVEVVGCTFSRIATANATGWHGADAGAVYVQWPHAIEKPVQNVRVHKCKADHVPALVYVDGAADDGRFPINIVAEDNDIADSTCGFCFVTDKTSAIRNNRLKNVDRLAWYIGPGTVVENNTVVP